LGTGTGLVAEMLDPHTSIIMSTRLFFSRPLTLLLFRKKKKKKNIYLPLQ